MNAASACSTPGADPSSLCYLPEAAPAGAVTAEPPRAPLPGRPASLKYSSGRPRPEGFAAFLEGEKARADAKPRPQARGVQAGPGPTQEVHRTPFVAHVDTAMGRYDINALLVTNTKDYDPRGPLVVYSHGAGNPPEKRKLITCESAVPKVQEFLRLGFNVLIVERRGYGNSTEEYVEIPPKPGDPEPCKDRDFLHMGRHMESDVLGTLDHALKQGIVNPEDILLVGKSRGGFLSVFASGAMHPRVRAVISFSGGAGGKGPNNCNKPGMTEALKTAGARSDVPTLWIYSENDSYFFPDYAREMHADFCATGGEGDFVMLPPFGDDGHYVFEQGVDLWRPHVAEFLDKHGLSPSREGSRPRDEAGDTAAIAA